jgi:FG-GAP-like repeat
MCCVDTRPWETFVPHTLMTSLGVAVASLLLTLTAAPAQASSGQFQSPAQYPGTAGLGHGAVVSADFNGDSYPDLAVADFAAGGVRVLLNRGDTFADAVFYPTGLGAGSVTAADFNGDGDVDLAVANTFPSAVVVFTNRGDGTFTRTATYPVGLLPVRVLTADFNGDRRPDLATASTVPGGNIVVFLNQGSGRFARSQTLTVGVNALSSMETADVNGDGRPDLLVGDQTRGVTVLIGRGDGTFTTGATLPIPIFFEGFAVGDVNRDSIIDVAIPVTFQNEVFVFLGRGEGTFAPPIVSTINPQLGVPALPVAAVTVDVNGDGVLDLAVSGGLDNKLYIMVGDRTGRFMTTESYPVQEPRTIIVDDFNHDGRPDLALTELFGKTAVLLHT